MYNHSDKSGVLGLGGVIGGTRSSTGFSTKQYFIRISLFFTFRYLEKLQKSLNIDTDAKYRFERGIDPNSIKMGLELGNVYGFRYLWRGSVSKLSSSRIN